MYTNNNPLMYMLTITKLDAMNHHWVASLVNYNFQLYYRAGKTNIDADALLRVSWPLHLASLQEATCKGLASSIEVYSCSLHILNPVGDGLQVTCMTVDDWHQA